MTPLPHVHPALFVGTDEDAHRLIRTVRSGVSSTDSYTDWHERVADGWHICHCAKSPWHVNLLGYTTRSAPADHPERWYADREHRTYLNLVDSPAQLPELVLPILDHAAKRIDEAIDGGLSVLVQCNAGLSRSPAVCLWWMHKKVPEQPYDEALEELRSDHPYLRTDSGIMEMVCNGWVDQ